jgi:hypothetical protein
MGGRQVVRIASVNLRGGIIQLDDGSAWRVAPDQRQLIRGWAEGQQLLLDENEVGKIFANRLVNQDTGVAVSVVPSKGESIWPWMQP